MIPQIGDILQIKTKIRWLSPIFYGIVIDNSSYNRNQHNWNFRIKGFDNKKYFIQRYFFDNGKHKYTLSEDGYESYIDIKKINLDK